MSHFYSDDSVVLWNGNAYTGSSSITSFYQALPSSEHVLHSVDCQPVSGKLYKFQNARFKISSLEVTGEQSTVIVTCEGEVKYEESNSQWEIFSHHFVLKKIGDVWKIVNDTFRVIPHS